MSAVCPSGHQSATVDYCDQCGALIAAPRGESVVDEVDTSAAAQHEPCPGCGAQRSGDDRYCERCGRDFLAPQAAVWEAVAVADRATFDRNTGAGVPFPASCPERRFALSADELRIGRSRGRPGEQLPDIDLAGEPGDPGVSHLHALLRRQADGSYTVLDLGSTNGTTINDDPTPIEAQIQIPLADGDRIRLGVWTTLTLRRR
jgi:hypothetical protein